MLSITKIGMKISKQNRNSTSNENTPKDIDVLRMWRDNIKTNYGRGFVKAYYIVGPYFAIEKHLKSMVRILLMYGKNNRGDFGEQIRKSQFSATPTIQIIHVPSEPTDPL